MRNEKGLPPLVGNISEGSITWQRLDNINYEELGYFLSCHLIIEHYLDEYLKAEYKTLSWDDCKLTFAQKINLLSNFQISEPYKELIPSIKAMNKIRNKISHRVNFKISIDDLEPLKYSRNPFNNIRVVRCLHNDGMCTVRWSNKQISSRKCVIKKSTLSNDVL